MGRPRKTAPAPVEPEFESQEIPEEEEVDGEEEQSEPITLEKLQGTFGGMSKANACRAALADGITETADAVNFCKSRFGIEIKPSDFTLYKSKEKAKQVAAAPAKPGRKPKTSLVEGYVAPPEKPKAAGEPDMLMALEGIKELVGQFGAEKVKRMVDLIG